MIERIARGIVRGLLDVLLQLRRERALKALGWTQSRLEALKKARDIREKQDAAAASVRDHNDATERMRRRADRAGSE